MSYVRKNSFLKFLIDCKEEANNHFCSYSIQILIQEYLKPAQATVPEQLYHWQGLWAFRLEWDS